MAQDGWLSKASRWLKGDAESQQAPLETADVSEAFKQALRIGSEQVVSQLGAEDGFNADPLVHIPLPKSMKKVNKVLGKLGMDGMLDDLELKLNRAAETATPAARELFVNAVQDMSFDDVMQIYQGPDDAATQYFRQKMSPGLQEAMRPLVDQSLSEVGALQLYDQVVGEYESLPFMPDVKNDLSDHVLSLSLDGIFHYLAEEEKAIRENPVRHTTNLLKRVFGGGQ